MAEKQPIEQENKVTSGRLILGGIILIGGFLSPLLIPWILSSDLNAGIKTTLSGLLAFGIPEITMIIALAIMGKRGLDYFKRKFHELLSKYGPSDQVSPTRYRIGLIMFILPFLVGFLMPYVQGNVPFLREYLIPISILLDLLLFSSLFVLGGNFWDKLVGLFKNEV